MSPHEERIARRVQLADKRREIIRALDGRYYFLPVPATEDDPPLSAGMLRALADELDKRNVNWTSEHAREFRNGTADRA